MENRKAIVESSSYGTITSCVNTDRGVEVEVALNKESLSQYNLGQNWNLVTLRGYVFGAALDVDNILVDMHDGWKDSGISIEKRCLIPIDQCKAILQVIGTNNMKPIFIGVKANDSLLFTQSICLGLKKRLFGKPELNIKEFSF